MSFEVYADFPGGNIIVDRLEGNTIHVRQDPRDTKGFWFYWYFGIRGAQGKNLKFLFQDNNIMTENGPAISIDDGRTWSWQGDSGDDRSFTYCFSDVAEDVRISMGMPYLQSNIDLFLQSQSQRSALRTSTLCKSRKGREVQLIEIGDPRAEKRVLLTARHHCCEMMASYVLEGVCKAFIENPRDFFLTIVPFVDKDGVEDGDQGKNRRPYDHNRDYAGDSLYPEIAAIRALGDSHRYDAFIDLHCPWIRGNKQDTGTYLVGSEVPENWKQQQRLSALWEKSCIGPLKHQASSDLPYGKEWNTGTGSELLKSSGVWAYENIRGIKVATTIEIPYSHVRGTPVTQDSARTLGEDLADALAEFLL